MKSHYRGQALVLTLIVFSAVGLSKPNVNACLYQRLAPNFADLNPSSKKPFDGTYTSPHERPLREYDDILFGGSQPRTLSRFVPVGGLAIDLGGGKGAAYRELAHKKDVRAVVVNTQAEEVPELSLKGKPKGAFQYRRGYAEQQLDKIEGQADLITDIWGAFSYSTEKAFLLEKIWQKLKPGGRAFVLYHPYKTETSVETDKGSVDFGDWLGANYSGVLRVYDSPGQDTSSAKIIELQKPKDKAATFQLPLITKLRENRHTNRGMDYPTVVYRVAP